MANLNRVLWTAAALLLVTCSVELATAAERPADLCSLLPAAVVSKTLGETYGPRERPSLPGLTQTLLKERIVPTQPRATTYCSGRTSIPRRRRQQSCLRD